MLRIYGIARTRAFRALWMAMELGLDYEHVPIEIGEAGARTPEFLAINPNGRLPVDRRRRLRAVRVAGDHDVSRQEARHRHALSRHGSKTRRKTWQWTLWALNEVDRGVNIWSLHAIRLPPAEHDAAKRDEALKVIEKPFRVSTRRCRSSRI